MKIKHNIIREGKTLSGKILDTIFDSGEKRGDSADHRTKDGQFCLASIHNPGLCKDALYVFGEDQSYDNEQIGLECDSEKEAQEILNYINEFTITDDVDRVMVDKSLPPSFESYLQEQFIKSELYEKFIKDMTKEELVQHLLLYMDLSDKTSGEKLYSVTEFFS